MSKTERIARELVAHVQVMIEQATAPLFERYERVAALVRKLDTDTDEMAEGIADVFTNHKQQITRMQAAIDALERRVRAKDGIARVEWLREVKGERPRPSDSTANALTAVTTERDKLRRELTDAGTEIRTLREQLAHAKENALGHAESAKRHHTEAVELRQKLEVLEGAASLADREWNQLRAAVTPMLPDRLSGQSLVDALPTTITELRDELRHTAERLNAGTFRATDLAVEVNKVWQLVAQPDGFGSPYWSEPALADTKPSDAIAAVLTHLRERATYWQRQAENGATEQNKRIRDLEEQLKRRDKLDAIRLHEVDDRNMRIIDIADEKFGPFPVMGVDDAIEAISKGCYLAGISVNAGITLYEQIKAQAAAYGAGAREALARYEDTERNRRQQQAEWEATFGPYAGSKPEPDDCQAGTCDCPARPGTYDIDHREPIPSTTDAS